VPPARRGPPRACGAERGNGARRRSAAVLHHPLPAVLWCAARGLDRSRHRCPAPHTACRTHLTGRAGTRRACGAAAGAQARGRARRRAAGAPRAGDAVGGAQGDRLWGAPADAAHRAGGGAARGLARRRRPQPLARPGRPGCPGLRVRMHGPVPKARPQVYKVIPGWCCHGVPRPAPALHAISL